MLRVKNPDDKSLTPREIEVLQYVCEGLTNNEIGSIIYITNHTVKRHVSSIIEKLSARNRTSAVYIAVKQNIVS